MKLIIENSACASLGKRQVEDTCFETQLKTIFHYLQEHVATASMVAAATGVPQKCITRYKRDLQKAGNLWEIERKPCKQTGFKAFYLTTDSKLAPSINQLNLF